MTEGRFNPYLTCKYDGGDNDITDIEEVMPRFDIDSIDEKWLDNHVLFEVDTLPVLLDGEESIVLSKIIEESFKDVPPDRFRCVKSRIPYVANIVIDKDGNASFKSLTKATGCQELDKKAISVGKEFCKHRFSPATHRGKKVSYSTNIAIMRKEWGTLSH